MSRNQPGLKKVIQYFRDKSFGTGAGPKKRQVAFWPIEHPLADKVQDRELLNNRKNAVESPCRRFSGGDCSRRMRKYS